MDSRHEAQPAARSPEATDAPTSSPSRAKGWGAPALLAAGSVVAFWSALFLLLPALKPLFALDLANHPSPARPPVALPVLAVLLAAAAATLGPLAGGVAIRRARGSRAVALSWAATVAASLPLAAVALWLLATLVLLLVAAL